MRDFVVKNLTKLKKKKTPRKSFCAFHPLPFCFLFSKCQRRHSLTLLTHYGDGLAIFIINQRPPMEKIAAKRLVTLKMCKPKLCDLSKGLPPPKKASQP